MEFEPAASYKFQFNLLTYWATEYKVFPRIFDLTLFQTPVDFLASNTRNHYATEVHARRSLWNFIYPSVMFY